jgi:hypothetical protein
MVQSKSGKLYDFTEVLDALEAIDAFPFGKNLSGNDEEKLAGSLQIAPDPQHSSKSWLLHLLNTVTWGRAPQATAQATSIAYMEEDISFPDEAAAELLAQISHLEQEAIEAELGLLGDLAALDLQQIRRNFAKENHPDRFDPAKREEATRRMTLANMLIDEALKRRKI